MPHGKSSPKKILLALVLGTGTKKATAVGGLVVALGTPGLGRLGAALDWQDQPTGQDAFQPFAQQVPGPRLFFGVVGQVMPRTLSLPTRGSGSGRLFPGPPKRLHHGCASAAQMRGGVHLPFLPPAKTKVLSFLRCCNATARARTWPDGLQFVLKWCYAHQPPLCTGPAYWPESTMAPPQSSMKLPKVAQREGEGANFWPALAAFQRFPRDKPHPGLQVHILHRRAVAHPPGYGAQQYP